MRIWRMVGVCYEAGANGVHPDTVHGALRRQLVRQSHHRALAATCAAC